MTRAWRVILGISLLLALACTGSALILSTRNFSLSAVAILSALALLASAAQSTRLTAADASVSLTSILLGAAIPLSGPLGAAAVGCVSAIDPIIKRPLVGRAFNVAMTGLVGVLGGLTYRALGGVVRGGGDLDPMAIVGRQLLPLAAATVIMLLANAACVGMMISVSGGPSILITVRRLVAQVGRTYLGYGVVGFLFAVLWDAVGLGPATVLVMFAPLVFAQWSYYQQHAESAAHERTVSSLVAAGEARDPIMRGRNERVANVSEVLGNQLRLSPSQSDALHFAALLHDVGMVAPVDSRHSGGDRQGDLDRIRRHPARGVEMLRSIEFLGDSITAIRHHHERWDGCGYPDGLAGRSIPRLARILAVADTFCALVPRVGLDETVATIRGRAGRQFDPDCVDALVEVADAAHELAIVWSMPDDATFGAHRTQWLDHDLPDVSDILAAERAES